MAATNLSEVNTKRHNATDIIKKVLVMPNNGLLGIV